MGALLKRMETAKPDGLQEAAAKAVVALLTVRSNRKDLVRDEKSLMRLVQILDPKYELASKTFSVSVIAAVMGGGSQGCWKRLVAVGAFAHLQRMAEMEVAEAKKTV